MSTCCDPTCGQSINVKCARHTHQNRGHPAPKPRATHPNSAGPQLPQIPELHATHPNSVGPPRAPSGSRVPPIPPGAFLFLLRRGPQQFLFGEIFVCSQIELTTCLSVLTESISQAMPCSFSHQSINQPKLTDVKASPASLQRPTCFQPSSRET